MAVITITEAKLADVTLGIQNITWDALDMPLVDRDGEIQVAMEEEIVTYGAAGNITDLGGFVIKENMNISVPFIQSGADFFNFLLGQSSGTRNSGGGAPRRIVYKQLVITTENGVLTIFKTFPVKNTTIGYSDTDITKPGITFNAVADIARAAQAQLWEFIPA